MHTKANLKSTHFISLSEPADINAYLTEYCQKHNIQAGQISGIGAVRELNFAYYDFHRREYLETHIKENLEMIALNGNVSLKNNRPFVHLHILCGRQDGSTLGGHCSPGTIVYPGEIIINEYDSQSELHREHDEDTGLWLWHN